ncbi:threonine ammonia-lyase [Seleniivibrio woodruffii]|uniref:L-threonine ammonia-lyase n=1 Tax=Seleniivibrio woodruffii TaxID=1078050 RepID=A0A4R1K6D5_9BACT|nr:threonine ammonia-lyase [Seleniivibrio woodruffii]TCK59323.1 L-threonine ammonia-lyase [Seleniivibrio woodruffii]TVZ35638.1 threonine dehydratase [Seleniivibrio woodruffii]
MLNEITESWDRIKSYIKPLPLYYSNNFSEITGADIYFKLENLQRTGSFKIRGALNCILKNQDKCRGGIIAASAGNHAQGVAFSAKTLGIKAVIVMPEFTPMVKVSSTQSHGAEVVLHGQSFEDAYKHAVQLGKERGLHFIHPFDDHDVIAGQGTIGYEILREKPDIDQIVVPVGGGGLISGIAEYVKGFNPDIKIIGVQAEEAAGMVSSLSEGRVVSLSSSATFAEGIAVKQVGKLTFESCQNCVDDLVTVSEREIALAVLEYIERAKLVVEGAGAAPLAALLAGKIDVKDKMTVLVVSGGNIDVTTISRIISRGMTATGRFMTVSIILRDVPGALTSLSQEISRLQANIHQIDHIRNDQRVPLSQSRVNVSLETRGQEHIDRIMERLSSLYEIERLV